MLKSDQIRFSFDNLINYILKFQLTDIEMDQLRAIVQFYWEMKYFKCFV